MMDSDSSLNVLRNLIGLGPRDYVGIASASTYLSEKHSSCDWLKKHLLMFDRVFIDGIDYLTMDISDHTIVDTYRFLMSEGVLGGFPQIVLENYSVDGRDIFAKPHIPQLPKSPKSESIEIVRAKYINYWINSFKQGNRFKISPIWEELSTRLHASLLSDFCNTNAVSLESSLNLPNDLPESTVALKVVVEEFPVVADVMPFQDILQLRKDEEFWKLRAGIRNWCRKYKDLSESEVRDELIEQLEEYKNFMKLQKIKYNLGAIESIVSASAALIEDIVKLRFEKLFSRIFTFAKNRVDLAEVEMKAPHRELQYLVKIGERLGP
jgi:hypothetical protein